MAVLYTTDSLPSNATMMAKDMDEENNMLPVMKMDKMDRPTFKIRKLVLNPQFRRSMVMIALPSYCLDLEELIVETLSQAKSSKFCPKLSKINVDGQYLRAHDIFDILSG
ncbi:hypothetical protein EDD11_004742 [Mortierella claussenii]|nr:hypothetical protein EDD11_004742 [Mortierella claussenii]